MCNARQLSSNAFGFIEECPACEKIHIRFGTVVTIFRPQEFALFCQHISTVFKQHFPLKRPEKDTIYLRTDSARTLIALNMEEFLALYDLLIGAVVLLEVYRMLDDVC